MFRQGKPRAFVHNLSLAVMLSFVAGVVNITGVLSVGTLTTNVTGHFAYFAEDFILGNYTLAFTAIAYITAFFVGALTCGMLVESALKKYPNGSHTLPMLFEMAVLVTIALAFNTSINPILMACGLLFAMGMQNALVTKISQATVRTTHLTGLFTDLGIEISQLYFHRERHDIQKLTRSIYLRLAIILFFFIGCVVGGFAYQQFGLRALLVAAVSLLIALAYDTLRVVFHSYQKV